MNRRLLLKGSAWLGVSSPLALLAAAETGKTKEEDGAGIVLYCDLAIDPAREQEMLRHFHHEFRPAAAKFEGYIDVKMVKLRKVIQGRPAPPEGVDYRFQLTYRSEELRQKWIASPVHARVWPPIEDTVTNKNYLVLLTDVA